MSNWLTAALLFSSWIVALAALLVFLESWFAVSGRDRFVPRRASGAYGPVSVFLVMRGPAEKIERTIRSLFGQSYPFIELFLIYFEDDARQASLARELRGARSHVQVRLAPITHPVQMADDRIRALEQTEPSAKGRWYLVMDSGVMLDRLAIEASLEFAGTGEVSAVALRPGIQCRSFVEQFLAPSMEQVRRLMRIAERRRERAKKIDFEAPYLLVNRAAFESVNRTNRIPGILNEAGWTLWGYQIEGLRTFDGDGSRSLWREIGLGPSPFYSERESRYTGGAACIAVAGAAMAVVPAIGLAYGHSKPINTFTFPEACILAFAAASYALMAIGYYLNARRLHAAAWFAPLWFLSHLPASIRMLLNVRHDGASRRSGRSEVTQKAGKI